MLDDSSDEEAGISSNDQCTKYWLSPTGGLGCFAGSFQDVLSEIAILTGTQISIEDDVKGIQVSGSNAADVDDALEKLTQIEKPLVSFRVFCSHIGYVMILIGRSRSWHVPKSRTSSRPQRRILSVSALRTIVA